MSQPMFRSNLVVLLRVVVCLAFWYPTGVVAQVSGADLAGTVEDSTGARISDAKVKLINVLTGTESDSSTNREGVFQIPGVTQGSYTLQIERQGFATAQVTGLDLNNGDNKSLVIRLHVGSVSETIAIDAERITLNTSDASISTVVPQNFAANISINGRSFQDLITMTPGVLTQSPQALNGTLSSNGALSINGQGINTNYFLVDGVSGNFGSASLTGSRKIPSDGGLPGLTAIGTTQSLASIDALQEFRVLSSSYSAEYGNAPGGQVAFVTRSGLGSARNEIHGSAYYYGRYSASDAVDWFQRYNLYTTPIASYPINGYTGNIPYHQNDFGGTLGLPLIISPPDNRSDRSYLFSSFEVVHLSQPTAFLRQYTPSPELSDGVPGPVQALLLDFPNFGSLPGMSFPSLIPYFNFSPLPSSVRATGFRLDHLASPRLNLFIRYSDSPSDNEAVNLSSLTRIHNSAQTITAGVTSQLSAMRNNDFRIGFARSASEIQTSLEDIEAGTIIGPAASSSQVRRSFDTQGNQFTDLLADLGVITPYSPARGQVYIHIPGIGESTINVDQATSSLRLWNPRDTFALQRGRHFLRLGVDYRHILSTVTPAPLSVEADFFDENSLLNNEASAISITKTQPASPVFKEFSAFIQDEWRISKSLTLSPGLRWEVDPAPHSAHGMNAYTVLGSLDSPETIQLAPEGTPLWHTSWFNLAPRLGAAWSVDNRPGQETVVRGGAGVYFNSDNQPAAAAFNAIGFSATEQFVNAPVPVTPAQLDFNVFPIAPYTNTTVFAFPQHLQLPYVFQWNVSVDKALGRNQTLNASWVGANGHRLLQQQRININSENPDFGEVNYFPAGISSNYQSLQLKFQRSISPGIQALASYVWSHALDYGSTAPQFPLTYGNSDVDVRHNLQAALSWQEYRRSGGWVNTHFLGGWNVDGRLTARTGFPVNLMGNLFSDPATGDRYYSGVDLIPGQPLYLYGAQYPGGRTINGGPNAINPAFALPTGPNGGNAPRNLVRGFGDLQVNAAVGREFRFGERFNFKLRAEAFNVFNHPDLGYIDPVLSNALFGQPTLMLNQSLGSAGPLYQPGGPRSIQFSGRLHF